MSKVKNWTDFNKFSFSTIAINESGPTQVLSDEDAKATEQARKYLEEQGITVDSFTVSFSSDGVEAIPNEDPAVSYSRGGATGGDRIGGGVTVGPTGAHTSDSGDKLGDIADIFASAAEYADRGFKNTDQGDSVGFGSSRDAASATKREKIKEYFFGRGGGGVETVGSSPSGLAAFSSSSLNGGIDASNQKTYQNKKTEVLKTENPDLSKATGNLTQPNYYNIGKPSFVGSKEYKDILDSIGKNRKSALRFLEDIGVDTELIRERENQLVALRSSLDIKNSYPNDFTDFFILFKIDGDIDTFLGSTTPSPAFRVKDWYDYFIKIGFTKLIVQQGSYILDPGVYKFVIKDTDTKSKYFGSSILQQDGISNFHKYGLGGSAAEAKRTNTFSPGNAEKGRIDLCITPALPEGRNADGLDATTSGDQVIKNATSFDKILAAAKSNPSATLPYILAENNGVKSKREERRERREERKEEKKGTQKAEGNEEAGKVNESFSQNGMKYLKKFGR
jgi:hypothetical protein